MEKGNFVLFLKQCHLKKQIISNIESKLNFNSVRNYRLKTDKLKNGNEKISVLFIWMKYYPAKIIYKVSNSISEFTVRTIHGSVSIS